MYFRYKSKTGKEFEFGVEGVLWLFVIDLITKGLGG